MEGPVIAAIAVVITLIIAVPVTYFATISQKRKTADAKIGTAEERAREIIDEAVKTAETKKTRIPVGNQGGIDPHEE